MLERTVHLIDTPGFNDTSRSDAEAFQELAYWLAAADEKNLRLSGVVFLHRITDIRFHGSSQRALAIFKALCGQEAFCGVVVATTMWDRIATSDIKKAQDRQAQLKTKIEGDILAFGGKLVPISAAEVDPCNIVSHVVHKDLQLNLSLQKELRRHGCLLHQTAAGKIVYESLLTSWEATRDSKHGRIQEMTEALASLRATRAEAQAVWEKRIERELEAFEELVRRYRDRSQSEDCRAGSAPSLQPVELGRSSPATLSNHTAEMPDDISVSHAELESELVELKRQHDAVLRRQPHRLDRRSWIYGRESTTLGVIGTGLAVSQLVAAVACNVM